MSERVERAMVRCYPPDRRSNDPFFLRAIERHIAPESHVLDAGAGAGDLFQYDFRGRVAEMVGADLDERVENNPLLDRGVHTDLIHMPFEDNSFDVVFSRYVLEHVANPPLFLKEVRRVLRPGGRFLFLTPNKWHYVAAMASLTPHTFHEWYNRRRGRLEEDTFPTAYKLNSFKDVRRQFTQAGFEEIELVSRECSPNYLVMNVAVFYCGMLYERLVSRFSALSGIRVNLIGCFRKPPRKGDTDRAA